MFGLVLVLRRPLHQAPVSAFEAMLFPVIWGIVLIPQVINGFKSVAWKQTFLSQFVAAHTLLLGMWNNVGMSQWYLTA